MSPNTQAPAARMTADEKERIRRNLRKFQQHEAASVLAVANRLLRELDAVTKERAEREALDKRVFDFVRYIATSYDHDDDAHRYNTSCRVCDAVALLAELRSPSALTPEARGQ